MGYLYSNTAPAFRTAVPPLSRIHRALRRRLDACQERRREAALSPGNDEDYATWCREVARAEKLTRALTAHLTDRPFLFQIRSPQQPAMTPATDPETMSKPLSAAAVSAILSHGKWLGSDKIRLTCTHRTAPVLRRAGVLDPKALEDYDVPVKREGGLLTIDHSRHHFPPAPNGDASLFEPGGLFAGESALDGVGGIHSAIVHHRLPTGVALPDAARAELAALCEIPCTRTFEIPTGPQSKIRVQVIAFEDESFPTPSERERWKPAKPTDTQVHAAVDALRMSRRLADLEAL